ncbi:hypothetical protein Nepgr_013760 [Nepenthes gracilis]|uniref:Retrotransposon gag domain-containing protein n=1 Tax=Nepenthes gracilis TaxID=150966 RepID=A0AAD3SJH2_NEPGR|nr:hypothetical protein Nepgr_013760 [Nepenthes gracilis]
MASKRRNTRVGTSASQDREIKYLNLLERMVNIIELMEQRHMALVPASNPAPVNPGPTAYERFTAERMPEFLGELDPLKANIWMQRLKNVFTVIQCSEREKVTYATYKLEGKADSWWAMEKRVFGVPDEEITWEMFEEAFMKRYFLSSVRDQKEEEFIRLKQGNCTVAEYDAKFTELSWYAPYFVEDELRKAKKFQQGLRDEIRKHLVTQMFQTYAEILDMALIFEKKLETQKIFAKRAASQMSASAGLFKKAKVLDKGKSSIEVQLVSNSQASAVNCFHCGKKHSERPCFKLTGACFNCGQ